jgi:hypothetical protein
MGSAPSEYFASGLSAGRTLFLRGSVRRASFLDLPELSPSAPVPRPAGAHPAERVSPRARPMCTAASRGVLVPFNVSRRVQRPRRDRSTIDRAARRAPISGRLRLCRFDDSDTLLHTRFGGRDPLLRTAPGVLDAISTRRRKKVGCSTSTATSTRSQPRPRLFREGFGNQRSALRANLTHEQQPSSFADARRDRARIPPLQGLSLSGAMDRVHLLPRASPPARAQIHTRSTHRVPNPAGTSGYTSESSQLRQVRRPARNGAPS